MSSKNLLFALLTSVWGRMVKAGDASCVVCITRGNRRTALSSQTLLVIAISACAGLGLGLWPRLIIG